MAEAVNVFRGGVHLFRQLVQRAGVGINVVGGELVSGDAADADRALFAVNGEGLILVAAGVDGSFQHAVSAVFEPEKGEAGVLSFDVRMVQIVGVRHDFRGLAAHGPAEQVDAMDALVH